MSGPRRRPARPLSSVTSRDADSTRTQGTGTPAGRRHRSRGSESSGDRWVKKHPGRRVPLAAKPPRDRQEAGAARGESNFRQKDAAREGKLQAGATLRGSRLTRGHREPPPLP
ncbi:hypothetical protein NN561_007751 [Cricetulus griseus]